MAEKNISGVTYRYDRLPADQGFPLMLRVLKVLGSSDGLATVLTNNKLSLAGVASALGEPGIVGDLLKFVGSMDTGEVYSIVEELVSRCRADGEAAIIGVKPADTAEMLQVAAFAFQTEFAGFFGAGAASAGTKVRPAPAPSARRR